MNPAAMKRTLAAASLACLVLFGAPARPVAAPQSIPQFSIDEEVPAFAFAPDGRLVYAVKRLIKARRLELQRDDFWLLPLEGKPKRIVDGRKLVRSNTAFSYAVRLIRWSPDSSKLTAELLTSALVDARGTTEDSVLTLLLDDAGKEIKIQGADSAIPGATNATWLGDGVTVAYLAEEVKPNLLFSVNTVRPIAGRGQRMFDEYLFVAVAWQPREQWAVGIERDAQLRQPPKLVRLDLVKQTRQELAELEGYVGQLTLSPSGQKVAYFRDPNTLEVRTLADPKKAIQVEMALGVYQWALEERRVLLRRGNDRRSGSLAWVRLPDGAVEPVFNSLLYRDFQISPDGTRIGVTQPGSRYLFVYPLPQ